MANRAAPKDTFVGRIGAAVVSPRAAFAHSEAPAGVGRAPGDLAILLFAGFVAAELPVIVAAGWLTAAGELGAAFAALAAAFARELSVPLLALFAAAALLSATAGKRRALGADFDLACVAMVPAIVVHLVAGLADSIPGALVAVFGFGWSAVLLPLALQQARTRGRG